MQDFYQIDLPRLPYSLASELKDLAKSITVSNEKREWLQNFHNCSETIAYQEYGTDITQISLEVQNSLKNILCKYFPNEKIHYTLGKIEAVANTISITPPHCDRGRFLACNFILQTGGDDVKTVFYNYERNEDNLQTAINLKENDLEPRSSAVFEPNCWYVFNAQQAHGVKNITGSRYLLSILFESNIKYKEFVTKYKHLLRGCG